VGKRPKSDLPDPQVGMPQSLGQADERTAAVTCARCQGERYVLVRPASEPDPTDYRCQRCTRVLAGYPNVIDPLRTPASPEANAARVEGLRRARETRPSGALEKSQSDADAPVKPSTP
jgi:hypothetical protein